MMLALIYGLSGQVKALSLTEPNRQKWHDLKATAPPTKRFFSKHKRTAGKIHRPKSLLFNALLKVREALASDDVGVMFDDATIKALTTLYTNSKANYARVRHEIKQNRAIKLKLRPWGHSLSPNVKKSKAPPNACLILQKQCEFFDKDKEPYAVFIAHGARQ